MRQKNISINSQNFLAHTIPDTACIRVAWNEKTELWEVYHSKPTKAWKAREWILLGWFPSEGAADSYAKSLQKERGVTDFTRSAVYQFPRSLPRGSVLGVI